jgi:hypothetical protein
MFAVLAEDSMRQWISGVFDCRESAEAYLAQIPDGKRSKHSVIDLGGLTCPLYVCEDDKRVRFLTQAEAVAELERYAGDLRRDDEDWCYTNLYRIASEWRPERPGTDGMGTLPHHHVTNFTIECVEQNGFESLWR